MTKVQALLVVFIVALTAGFFSVGHFKPSAFGGFYPVDAKPKQEFKKGMVLTGDVMLARKVEYLMNRYGASYPVTRLNPFRSDTYVVGNFESAMSETHAPTPFYTFSFRTKVENVNALKTIGFTHLGLSNNHALDAGESGYSYATTSLTSSGFVTFGHPQTLSTSSVAFFEFENMRIAVVALSPLSGIPSEAELESAFTFASTDSDFQIAYIHWGTEYSLIHSRSQELLAQKLVDHGADLIVGHHPHVVQDVALVDGVPVFYSLGNFIFDQYFSDDVQQGLMLELHPNANSLVVELHPVTSIDMQSAPREMNSAEAELFLEALAARSEKDLTFEIVTGALTVSQRLAND